MSLQLRHFHRKFALSSVALASAILGPSAFANGGVTVIQGVRTPYVINLPGSYQLGSDLASTGTGAIVITAPLVTLDLNGFTISCTACSGSNGIQVEASGATIRNGTVIGFAGSNAYAIVFQGGTNPIYGKVDHLTVMQNGNGIGGSIASELTVIESNASNNTTLGIFGPGTLTVINSKVANNTQDGIFMANGLVTGSTINGNGLGGFGIRAGINVSGAATVTNNLISYNAMWGLGSSNTTVLAVGFGSNTFYGNGAAGDVPSGGGFTSMRNNVSTMGVF